MSSFSKEEIVMFEDLLQEFDDELVLSKKIKKHRPASDQQMERAGDVIWRPEPYIMQSYDGRDQTANFGSKTQLSVPAYVNTFKSSNWTLEEYELRDMLQEDRLKQSAKQKLSSDINISVMDVAANEGTLFVKRTAAATGFDDIAEADALMNEQGIQMYDRCIALSSRDYNKMAGNLAARQTMQGRPDTAYGRAYIGDVASFEALKLDYANQQVASAGSGITMDTQTTAVNYYTPRATISTTNLRNVDNRTQTITVTSSAGVNVGDALTIDGVEAVHHITKRTTGQLKTFRVREVPAGGTTLVISPPIISNQGSTEAEEQYQNVEVTESATAAVTFLNTQTASVNPFWCGDAIELIPGKVSVPKSAGVATERGTTESGIELVMSKFVDINTLRVKFRIDTFYGVNMLQPQMAGIMMFGQS